MMRSQLKATRQVRPGQQARPERSAAEVLQGRAAAPSVSKPLVPAPGQLGDAASVQTHAALLKRAPASQSVPARETLLALQQRYGNRYVQRVVALARQADDTPSVAPTTVRQWPQAVQRRAVESDRGAPTRAAESPVLQRQCASSCDCAHCAAQRTNEKAAALVQRSGAVTDRSAASTGERLAAPAPGEILRELGSGDRLDASIAGRFSEVYGAPLGHVRVHANSHVAMRHSAAALTIGHHMAFAPGRYQPGTPGGDELIGHELAHVVQQSGGTRGIQAAAGPASAAHEAEADAASRAALRGQPVVSLSAVAGVQRQLDARYMTITPAWATSLTEDELQQQIRLVREQIIGLAAQDPLAETAQANLSILQAEASRRPMGLQALFGGVDLVPRPGGLPQDEGYTLVEIPDVPPEIVAALPEGQLVDTLPMASEESATSTGGIVLPTLEAGGGSSAAVLTQTAQHLRTYGFAAGGQHTIGLVAFPQSGTPGHPILQSRLAWGHTAVYVRIDGQIHILRSHAPTSLLGTGAADVISGGGVKTGRFGVPGSFYGESYGLRGIPMFTHTGARSIEFPVSRTAALAVAEGLPDIGPSSLPYTGNPATLGLCQGMNCLRWAVPVVEDALGGPFGPLSPHGAPTSITGLGPNLTPGGAPDVSSQGRMYRWMGEAGRRGEPIIGWDNRTGARVAATIAEDGRVVVNALPEQAAGPPTVGQMSRGMKYLRWGGRVFLVVGIAAGIAEIFMASPEQRARVATEVGVGFGGGVLGGIAGGAAAGLVCGPGAPVCAVIGGIIGGILGAFGARSFASLLFDYDQAAYRAGVGHLMTTLKDKTQGHFVIDTNGQTRWVEPDPRYAEYAGAIQRFESGESGACQTCHDINRAWGRTAERWGSPLPKDPAWWVEGPPRQGALSDQELKKLTDWITLEPESKSVNLP